MTTKTAQPSAPALSLQKATPLLFVLLWSTGFIGAKYGLPYAEPMTFLAWRFSSVLLLMWLLVLVTRAPWPDSLRSALHIAISGLLIHAVYLGGVFTAMNEGLPSGITALVVGLQPLLTAVVAGALLGEHVRRTQWLGLVLGFLGVSLVVVDKVAVIPSDELFTMLTPAFIALLSITAGTLYQKRFCPSFDLRTGAVLQYLPCALLVCVLAFTFETTHVTWNGHFLFALGWLVLVLSIGAIALLNLLIRKGNAVNVASLFYLTPPTTALIAWLVFHETLSLLALIGMLVAATGVWLALRPAPLSP